MTGVSLTRIGLGRAHRLRCDGDIWPRDHFTADFGTDEALFPMTIRHAEAIGQACRERR